MKLKRLGIGNYRSIKKAIIKLSSGVNVFVGSSDSGKSNIIRAIRDLCFNATGTGFITSGKKTCKVFYNNVMWHRGKGVNKYQYEEGVLKNVGTKSPDEIRKSIRIDELNWDKNNSKRINFIEQHEPYFFLSYNDSLNAKILGKVSGIERIYIGNRKIIKDRSEISSRIKYVEEEIKKGYKSLIRYKNLGLFAKRIKEIKRMISLADNIQKKKEEISSIYEEYKTEKKKLKSLQMEIKEIDFDESILDKLQKITLNINSMKTEYQELVELKKDVRFNMEELKELQMSESEFVKDFDSLLRKSDICPLTKVKYFKSCKQDILKNA